MTELNAPYLLVNSEGPETYQGKFTCKCALAKKRLFPNYISQVTLLMDNREIDSL